MADSDAQVIENLKLQRDQLIARLAEVATSAQPDYSVTTKNGGESFTRSSYLRFLQTQLDDVLSLLQQLQPYIVNTKVYV